MRGLASIGSSSNVSSLATNAVVSESPLAQAAR